MIISSLKIIFRLHMIYKVYHAVYVSRLNLRVCHRIKMFRSIYGPMIENVPDPKRHVTFKRW